MGAAISPVGAGHTRSPTVKTIDRARHLCYLLLIPMGAATNARA